jgi:hypothetical protein
LIAPSLKSVESALRQATEFFVTELATPGGRAPDWSEFEWAMAEAAAILHGVSPLLNQRLQWQGPPKWCQFIRQQHEHTLLRHRRIEAVLSSIDQAARRDAVAAVALKGVALHTLGIYAAGQRPMADIDLLVQESDVEGMVHTLESVGYRTTALIGRHRVLKPDESAADSTHEPEHGRGERAHALIKIELHSRICERLPRCEVDATPCILPRAPHAGLNAYPSVASLFTHLLLHAAGNMLARTFRLIHLHDIAMLAARMGETDWDELMRTRLAARASWWAVPALELAARYYPGSIPTEVLAALRPACPRPLRLAAKRQSLSDVSYAAVRVELFPGLAWTASVSEKLQCIRARIRPDSEALAVRALTRMERWYDPAAGARGSSYWRSGLRVLFTRPPRVAPMYIVRASLQEHGLSS